VSYNRKMLQKN